VLHWSFGVVDWDAMQVAQAAYESSGGETLQFAKDWGNRMAAHIASYSNRYPAGCIREFLSNAPDQAVDGGYFLRWEFGSPVLQGDWIAIKNHQIMAYSVGVPHIPAKQSTNRVTTELIEGKTLRAKAAAQRWNVLKSQYPASELSWRRLQFLVEETSSLDPGVSRAADILEISGSGKVTWLVRNACR
jgi:hypothetical protein